MNNQQKFTPSPRAIANQKYTTARMNLLLVIAMSVINIILIAAQTDTYFLFSATLPVLITQIGVIGYVETEVVAVLIVFAVIAVVLTLPYLLCWIFSKKHYGWMIAALVYFSIDTLLMVFMLLGDLSAILDILFHIWILYYLIIGVKYGHQLKTLPESVPGEPIFVNGEESTVTENAADTPALEDTPALRTAYSDDKIKVYAEATVSGHIITYRKYGKNIEELVVDGYVYAELQFKGLAKPHAMNAVVNGMQITAGYYQKNYIMVNGNIVAETVRWI